MASAFKYIASYYTDGKPRSPSGNNKARKQAIGYYIAGRGCVMSFPAALNGRKIPTFREAVQILLGHSVVTSEGWLAQVSFEPVASEVTAPVTALQFVAVPLGQHEEDLLMCIQKWCEMFGAATGMPLPALQQVAAQYASWEGEACFMLALAHLVAIGYVELQDGNFTYVQG